MNPQDKVERVLKEIHVAFSKSPTYNGQPDKIIIDRKQFLGLLDRLNNGIYDMMEQYEQTRQSRQNAERAFRRKGDEIIEQANSSADDIYAAGRRNFVLIIAHSCLNPKFFTNSKVCLLSLNTAVFSKIRPHILPSERIIALCASPPQDMTSS